MMRCLEVRMAHGSMDMHNMGYRYGGLAEPDGLGQTEPTDV